MVPETDFPDIRNRCAIHSHNGSCMIIPREGDLIRLYIQLSDKDVLDPSSGRVDRNKMGPEMLLEVIFFWRKLSVYNSRVVFTMCSHTRWPGSHSTHTRSAPQKRSNGSRYISVRSYSRFNRFSVYLRPAFSWTTCRLSFLRARTGIHCW